MSKKIFEGIVISDKMDKTIVVKVESVKHHSKYKKTYRRHKNYKVHDENNSFKIGENVLIEECNPISKDKKWKAIEKISN